MRHRKLRFSAWVNAETCDVRLLKKPCQTLFTASHEMEKTFRCTCPYTHLFACVCCRFAKRWPRASKIGPFHCFCTFVMETDSNNMFKQFLERNMATNSNNIFKSICCFFCAMNAHVVFDATCFVSLIFPDRLIL